MGFDYGQIGGVGGKFEKLPKVGEKKVFNIVDVKQVFDGDKRFNYPSKKEEVLADGRKILVDGDAGYRHDIILEDGKTVSVSNWSVYYTMNPKDSDPVVDAPGLYEFNHPDKGKWQIRKVDDPDEVAWDD